MSIDTFGTVAILAGGREALRKGAAPTVTKRDICEILIDKLEKMFNDVLIVTNHPWHFEGVQARVEEDIVCDEGPLGGILTALKNSKSKYAYVIACDMPYLNEEFIEYMMNEVMRASADACVALKNRWIEPFHGFYSVDLYPIIEYQLREKDCSVYALLRNVNTVLIPEEKVREFDRELQIYSNLSSEEDLEQYMRTKKR